MKRFLTTHEVADLLRLDRHTLDNWRWAGKGPTWVKAGGRVLYPADDLERWLDESTQAVAR